MLRSIACTRRSSCRCARGLGSPTLYTQHPYSRRYSARDVHLAADLAGRAGLAVDNARLYETEHAAVITLQHSLLPALPKMDEVPLAARYLVGFDGNQVGGDWYDVLPLPDGDCLPGELRDDVALLMVGRAGPDNGGLSPLTDC